MRSGRLLALTLNKIHFETKIIRISKTYTRLNGEDIINPPKASKSNREITVPDFLLDILRDYSAWLADYEPHERLFAYSKHYLNKEMEKGCKLSGVKKTCA